MDMKNFMKTILFAALLFGMNITAMANDVDPNVGKTFRIQSPQNFYRFNYTSKETELVTVPAGTTVQLDQVKSTLATRSKQSYWYFRILTMPNQTQAGNLNIPVWVRHKNIPVGFQQHADISTSPVKDIQILTSTGATVRNEPLRSNNTTTLAPQTRQIEVLTTEDQPPAPLSLKRKFPIVPSGNKKNGFGPECTNFIDEGGNLGAWGRHIKSKLQTSRFQDLIDPAKVADIGRYCPAFKDFDLDTKQNFFVYFMASMAAGESSCNRNIVGRGPNGAAVGIFQLLSGRQTDGRCRDANMRDPYASIDCAMNIMDDQLKFRSYFSERMGSNQWQVLTTGRGGHSYKVTNRLDIASACKLQNAAPVRRTSTVMRATPTDRSQSSNGNSSPNIRIRRATTNGNSTL